MLIQEKQKLGDLLIRMASVLDIPDHVYEDATLKYEDVGTWLAAEDSELKDYTPEIYPQGSFALAPLSVRFPDWTNMTSTWFASWISPRKKRHRKTSRRWSVIAWQSEMICRKYLPRRDVAGF